MERTIYKDWLIESHNIGLICRQIPNKHLLVAKFFTRLTIIISPYIESNGCISRTINCLSNRDKQCLYLSKRICIEIISIALYLLSVLASIVAPSSRNRLSANHITCRNIAQCIAVRCYSTIKYINITFLCDS